MTHPRLIIGAALLAALAAGCAGEAPTSTLITNVSIVDGTGSPARTGAVRIDGDRIIEVGELEPKRREQVVDAGGLTLAPGFIDVHSHHDRGLFEMRDAAPVGAPNPDPHEDVTVEVHPIARVREMVLQGEIHHSLSVCALLLFFERRAAGGSGHA